LKAIRVPKGYRTARSFARALDIDENRYTRYERAEVEPSLDLLLRICELLGATPNDLLCDYIGTPATIQGTAGFAEERGYPSLSGDNARSSGGGIEQKTRTDATAWLLATELATLQTRQDAIDGEVSPFRRLELTSEIFHKVKTSPFGVFSGLAAEMRSSQADMETQTRIYALVDELVKELRDVSPEPV
jgi:transcriptional regulator with XRE-family HTH domain